MAITKNQLEKVISFAKLYGATRLILFGSSAETPDKARDIDLACDGVPGWKLYEFAAKLEEELNTPLDIVALSPSTSFTKYIESKGKVLYDSARAA